MSVESIVNKWLSDVQVDLVKNYNRLGLKASGNWPNQLEPTTEIGTSNIKAGMLGAPYTGAIENGRSANFNQSEEAITKWVGWAGNTFIKQWVQDKGIDISPFAVAYKIAREGWKVPNKNNAGGLVSDVVNKKRIGDLMRELSLSRIEDIKSDLLDNLK